MIKVNCKETHRVHERFFSQSALSHAKSETYTLHAQLDKIVHDAAFENEL